MGLLVCWGVWCHPLGRYCQDVCFFPVHTFVVIAEFWCSYQSVSFGSSFCVYPQLIFILRCFLLRKLVSSLEEAFPFSLPLLGSLGTECHVCTLSIASNCYQYLHQYPPLYALEDLLNLFISCIHTLNLLFPPETP